MGPLETGYQTFPLKESSFNEMNAIGWNCVGREMAPQGGCLYEFRFNEEKRRVLYHFSEPPIEPLPEDEFSFESFSRLSFLGYKKTDKTIYLPDKEALLNAWSQLFPERELKILDSNGPLSHIDFVKGYINHDVILSNQKEFVHDQIFHVVPTLNMMIDTYNQYKREKRSIANSLTCRLKIYDTLPDCQEKQAVALAFGALVDQISSSYDIDSLKSDNLESRKKRNFDYTELIFKELYEEVAKKEFGAKFFEEEERKKLSAYYKEHFFIHLGDRKNN
jgi:hypothetical protein